ncbi:AraC family transcriptional regulator [Erysipelotrichaceae bacterium RD49]|nr:AraC family transcriptional regulator [Erysipelotrichaceae bacterium RD49]
MEGVPGNRKENVIFTIFENFNSVDLTAYQCGKEKCLPGHLFGPAARRHYLLHYILKGKGTLISPDASGENRSYSLHAGQGFLLYPETVTTYYADGEDPWEYIWLEFDGLKVMPALEQTSMTPSHPIYQSTDDVQRDAMISEMQFLLEHSKASPYLISGHLYLFLEAFIQSARLPDLIESNSLADYYVRETIAFIENNYSRNISIEDIASSLGISRSYLTKILGL